MTIDKMFTPTWFVKKTDKNLKSIKLSYSQLLLCNKAVKI